MDMLSGTQITAADVADWRKLGQGLHARFVIGDLSQGVRFLAAISQTGGGVGDHLHARIGPGYVDLKLISNDAIYRDDAGVEHPVEWVTQSDLDLAGRITQVAAEQSVRADPSSITTVELVLDTANAGVVAPVWSALLTGGLDAQGRGTIGEDVRDASGRVPILSFQEIDPQATPPQRFHLDIQVPFDVAGQRIAAAVAAGAVITDDSQAPHATFLADPEGNRACVSTYRPAFELGATTAAQSWPRPV